MILRCPGCGLKAGAEAWANDANARATFESALKLPAPLPEVLLQYLAFFRPEKTAASWSKALRLTKELAELVAKRSVQYGYNPARACTPGMWAQAIEKMIAQSATINRPLPNHNYLIKVAWGIADEADAKIESRRNEAEKRGDVSAMKRSSVEEPGLDSMSEEDKKFLPPGLRNQLGV